MSSRAAGVTWVTLRWSILDAFRSAGWLKRCAPSFRGRRQALLASWPPDREHWCATNSGQALVIRKWESLDLKIYCRQAVSMDYFPQVSIDTPRDRRQGRHAVQPGNADTAASAPTCSTPPPPMAPSWCGTPAAPAPTRRWTVVDAGTPGPSHPNGTPINKLGAPR